MYLSPCGRFRTQMSGIELSPLNIHRISITAVMVAAKFFDDLHWDNTAFARIGGISTREVRAHLPRAR